MNFSTQSMESIMPKVLIADQLSPAAVAIFKERGVEAETKTGLTKDQLLNIIGEYDGLAVRSATKVNAEVLKAAKRLKVIGRAGIGVDNIDVPAATAAGINVMKTPFGNTMPRIPTTSCSWTGACQGSTVCRPAARSRLTRPSRIVPQSFS